MTKKSLPPMLPPEGARDWRAWVVAVAAVLPFLPALRNGLVWDDTVYVTGNELFRMTWPAAISRAFTHIYVGNWHPITMLSLALDNGIGGPGPRVFHLVNLAVHGGNAILVYLLLRRLAGHAEAACAGALIWAVHPLRVESVAWISERKDLLYAFFFLLALLAYLRHAERGGPPGRAYAASLVLFTLSSLCKAMAVSLVPVLFLIDGIVARGLTKRAATEKLPFLVLGLLVGTVAIVAQKSSGAIPQEPALGLPSRLAFGCYGLMFYLVKTVAPIRLSGFYPYPAGGSSALPVAVWGGIVATAVLTALSVAALRRRHLAAFGAAFFAATVALVLQVLPVGGAVAADRYSYLPAVGISIAIAAALAGVDRGVGGSRPVRRALWTTVLAATAALAGMAWIRCGVWRDDLAFWSDVLAKHPDVVVAQQNLGVFLDDHGDAQGALAHYEAAIRLDPGFAEARWSHGNVLAARGDLPAALTDYAEAIRLDPSVPKYRFNQGLRLGDVGRWNEALAALGEAIRLKPDFAEAYLNRGLALEQMGRARDGAPDVLRALQLGYPVEPAVLLRFETAGRVEHSGHPGGS